MAVVVGQAANAFACRSTTRSPWALGWTTNRLLPAAIAAGCSVSLVALFVGPVARQLEHANPPLVGWVVALSAAPLVLAADAIDKRFRRNRHHS